MDEQTASQRIIVGVDGSPSSVQALRQAERLATALGATIEAVCVWSYPPMAGSYVQGWSPEAEAMSTIDEAVARAFGDRPPHGLERRVIPGPPAPALIGESKGAGMLVLGSRGHGGFAGLLLGSVSTACAQYAHCPVLIVHGEPRM